VLKKDLLELCLLQLLEGGDRYGYELLRQLHAAFPDTQESTVYAILRGLCRQGHTEHYRGESSGGPARKYYRLTCAGQVRREELLTQWRMLCAALVQMGVK